MCVTRWRGNGHAAMGTRDLSASHDELSCGRHAAATAVGLARTRRIPHVSHTRERDNANMLELRPTCENCNRPLAPDATDAMICTYECTFCRECVDAALSNVCPNCGGGFERRPVRPAQAWGYYAR